MKKWYNNGQVNIFNSMNIAYSVVVQFRLNQYYEYFYFEYL